MTKHLLLSAWVGIALVVVVPAGSLAAEQRADSSSHKDEARTEDVAVEKKLREILKNQEQILANQTIILQKFDAVMEELRIIKIRATIRGGS